MTVISFNKFLKKLLFLLFATHICYANEKSKYSEELGCNFPLGVNNIAEYFMDSEREIDLEYYKTVIRNGNIKAIDSPYLNDLQLGVLSKLELKLFRNLFYAKKGYIFSDNELTKYFSQFEWYKPVNKSVKFTDLEINAIEKIKIFESDSSINYEFENRDIVWETFNGGSDQKAPFLKLSRDKTFKYIPSSTINRIENIDGNWEVFNNRIILHVKSENIVLGGYIANHPNTPYIDKGTPVVITYKAPLQISLPINESELYKKYSFNFGEKWIKIGSSDCYISNKKL